MGLRTVDHLNPSAAKWWSAQTAVKAMSKWIGADDSKIVEIPWGHKIKFCF